MVGDRLRITQGHITQLKKTLRHPFQGTKDMGQTPYLQKVFLAMLGYFLGHLFMYFILKILLLLGIILLLL